jgi:hypothetical protein
LLSSHSAYGLRIVASGDIPGLSSSEVPGLSDIAIHLNDGTEFPALAGPKFLYASDNMGPSGQPALRVGQLYGGAYGLFYGDGARFAVDRDGRKIIADWPSEYCLEDAATYLVGPVLAFALRLRGRTCLHASAVAIDDRAVALVGSPGAGKSTTAAAFAARGYPVLSDDLAALAEERNCFWVKPGYPRVNLWPDSVHALFGSLEALPRITPTWDKRFLALDRERFRFEPRALPLGAVYILGRRGARGSACHIDPLAPPAAMVALAANTYMNYLLNKDMRSKEFHLLGRLVNSVAVRCVEPPDDAERSEQMCEAIAADAKEVLASPPAFCGDSH